MKRRKLLSVCIAASLLTLSMACTSTVQEDFFKKDEIKNVILLIGDGMGQNQIKAAELYKKEKLFLQTLTQQTFVETRSANEKVTDSAAASTAYATGIRTNNGVVGRSPDGTELETIVDLAKSKGKSTGVITTEELYGATPMGFAAHANSREEHETLLLSAATTSNVDLFVSYNLSAAYKEIFTMSGYTLVENAADISECSAEKVFGAYNINALTPSMVATEDVVAFDRVVVEALEYLSRDSDGFFLMAEGAKIDKASHSNDMNAMLRELLAFDDMVKAVVNWASDRRDTLVLVTADHETGGLTLKDGITSENMFETARGGGYKYFSWSGIHHTATDVYFYAYGPKVDFAAYSSFGEFNRVKNIDCNKIMRDFLIA